MKRTVSLALILSCAISILPSVRAQEPPLPPGHVLVDDMILPEEVVFGESAFTANPWPFGVVAYVFNANVSAANQVQALKAMNEIAAVCGAIFVPRTNHPDWIIFNAATVNNSLVGMQGGGQTINITSWGTKYIIVHEIMHALGYIHEQSRPDRDNFVTINFPNISTSACPGSNCGGNGSSSCVCNFNIVNGANQTTGYDFESIMHYGRTAFTSNGFDTITCKPAYAANQNVIGNRAYMSLGDAQGLRNRYGSTLFFPNLTSISPTSVTTATGSFTLHVYGSNFFEGSPNASGVQGTRILWNGAQLATTYVDAGHVTAQIPASLTSRPATAQIGITNPSPAWGALFNTLPLSIVCATGALALSNGSPATVTNGCQQYSINPVYSAFNVVGVSSTTDWDIQMGTASAAAGGNTCDFVAGSGWFGAGTIQPVTGNVTLYSGSAPATLQHVTSTELLNGQPTIASMPAGSIVRAFHFGPAAVSTRTIHVAGPTNLRWKLLWSGNSPFSWRSSTANVTASGLVGSSPVSGIGVVPAPYCLVVYSDGGPIATTADLTITMCFDFTPAQLSGGNNITTINQGPYSCVPWSIPSPTPKWQVIGVTGATDWDIQCGPAVSQYGGSSTDYVLANGHLGGIWPLTGVCSPYTYSSSPGYLQYAFTATLPQNWYSYTYMLLAFEFEITTPGTYDISVNGAPGYNWDLHVPGANAAWRRRADRLVSGSASGSPITVPNLQPGWHCVVVYHDGGPTGLVSPSIGVAFSTAQTPVLSSISPALAPAGGAGIAIQASGNGFGAASVVRWNGSDLATSFAGPTSLSAAVPAALLAAAGTAQVTVFNPGAGGGTSAPQTFTIQNPAPVLASLTPASAPAGGPSMTLLASGSGFTGQSVVQLEGVPLATTFVSATQLSAAVPASALAVPGIATVTVSSPAPGGGLSAGLAFDIRPPVIAAIAPASIAVMNPASAPVNLTITGSGFAPGCRVIANGDVLPLVSVTAAQIVCTLGPSVPQARRPGAIAINVENTAAVVSNTKALVVGSGANQGTIRRAPLAPLPGQAYAALIEGGASNGLFSLYIDLGNVPPVTAWPWPSADLVLAVGPYAGSTAPFFPLIEGIGLHGPPTGATLGFDGSFTIPGFVAPNPAIGLDLTAQALFLDPTAPHGFRLSWSRWPDRL